MQNKEFLKTLGAGDIVIRCYPLGSAIIKDKMLVKAIRGNVIEIVPLEIHPDTAEILTSFGLPPDKLYGGNHYSAITGGVIDVRRGHDGNLPDDDYLRRHLYSELIGKG
jgi:hypothetical protein